MALTIPAERICPLSGDQAGASCFGARTRWCGRGGLGYSGVMRAVKLLKNKAVVLIFKLEGCILSEGWLLLTKILTAEGAYARPDGTVLHCFCFRPAGIVFAVAQVLRLTHKTCFSFRPLGCFSMKRCI